jgi:hypothetical protein
MANVVKMPLKKSTKGIADDSNLAKGKKKATVNGKKSGGKFTGKTSGLGVTAFQNDTLLKNTKRANRLTDTKLAALWRKEFPDAVSYTEATVSSVRSLVNRGKHSNDVPDRAIPAYDKNGDVIKATPPAKKATPKVKAKAKKVVSSKEDDDEEEE